MKTRILYLDFSRGFLIFIVVLTHCWFPLTNFLFFWDVQVFFILSGIFLTPESNLENTLVKRVQSLVYPFLFFSIPIYSLLYIYNLYSGDVSSLKILFPDSYGLGTEWFLIVLAVDVFLLLLINQLQLKWGGGVLVLLYFILSYITYKVSDNQNFLVMSGVTLPLLYIGYLYRRFSAIFEKFKLIALLLSCATLCLYAYFKCDINIIWMRMSVDPISYFIVSIAGFFLVVSIAIYAQKYSERNIITQKLFCIISKWGFNSLYILIIHWPIRLIINRINTRFELLEYYNVLTSIILAIVLCEISYMIGIRLKKIKYINLFLK